MSCVHFARRRSRACTAESKQLNNGFHAGYAGWSYNSIPKEFVSWILGPGRKYFETGRMVYAPFIPPLEEELEFMKSGVSVPEYFNSTPCFHQQYEALTENAVSALLSLKFPCLDGL
jgi:hypothetical protein